MIVSGEYLVVGNREYRGHAPGSRFVAQLDAGAARRAIYRQDIELIREVVPSLEPGSYRLPEGWLDSPSDPVHRGAERRLSR